LSPESEGRKDERLWKDVNVDEKMFEANDLVSEKYQQQSRFLRKLADVAFFYRICFYWVNGKVRVLSK